MKGEIFNDVVTLISLIFYLSVAIWFFWGRVRKEGRISGIHDKFKRAAPGSYKV